MKEYTFTRCNGMPNWNTIPATGIDQILEATEPTEITAQAQVCYDDTALYVRLSAKEKDIRAELYGPLEEICEDCCLEFFFAPVPGDRRYMNIECNFNNAMYLGIGSGPSDLIRLVPEHPVIKPQAMKTDDGWETVYTVPYSYIRQFFPDFAPCSGYSARANFYKCADKTDPPHYICWNPVPMQDWAFHNPEHFGIVHFE